MKDRRWQLNFLNSETRAYWIKLNVEQSEICNNFIATGQKESKMRDPIKYCVFKICRIHKVIMKCGAILFHNPRQRILFSWTQTLFWVDVGQRMLHVSFREGDDALSLLSYLLNGNGETIVTNFWHNQRVNWSQIDSLGNPHRASTSKLL